MRYAVNEGPRDQAIRVGLEAGIKQFIEDYAADMGMSASGAARRLILIGSRCEAEHGNARMPASYKTLFYDPEERTKEAEENVKMLSDKPEEEFDWGEIE
jgi:hypothetical protein